MRKLILALALVFPLVSFSNEAEATTGATIINSLKNVELIPLLQEEKDKKTKNNILCLAINIYHEAESASSDEKFNVGFVTKNRLIFEKYDNDICKIISDPKQFGWVVLKKNYKPRYADLWIESQKIAYIIYSDPNYPDPTDCALFFHNPKRDGHKKYFNAMVVKLTTPFHIYSTPEKLLDSCD